MGLIRLIKEADAANAINSAFEDAAKNPTLYLDPHWIARVLRAAWALYQQIPLPEETRRTVSNALAKIGMIAGVIVGVSGQVGSLPFGSKYSAIVGSIATIAGVIAGLLHTSPTQPAQ